MVLKLKTLKLENWMLDYGLGQQGIFNNEYHRNLYEREAPYYVKEYPLEGQVQLPNGWYLEDKHCFFVVNKKAYRCEVGRFRYTLDMLSNYEKIGNIPNTLLLASLEKKVHGRISKETAGIVRAIEWHQYTLNLKKDLVRHRKMIRELIKQKKLQENTHESN